MKYTTTEKYYTNCPNCGASLGPEDKYCTYCGTRIVYERSYTQEDTVSLDMSKVDFESEADGEISGAGNIISIIGLVFFCAIAGMMMLGFFSFGGIVGVFPMMIFGFGLVMLVQNISNYTQYNEIMQSAPRYDAVVLDHQVYTEVRGSGDDRHSVTLAKVKVAANINGQQKVILIKVGDPKNAASYPERSHIKIAGRGHYFVIVK